MIHELVTTHAVDMNHSRTQEYLERHETEPFPLAMSGMGGCVRESYLQAFMYDTGHPLCKPTSHPFDVYTLLRFEMGRMFEDHLDEVMQWNFRHDEYDGQRRLGDDVWSGRSDFIIWPKDDYPQGLIVECKSSMEKGFAHTMKRIPRLSDALQVLCYQKYMRWEFPDAEWPAKLYYMGLGHYAEFDVWEAGASGIVYDGCVGRHDVEGAFDTLLADEMWRIDRLWDYAHGPGAELDCIPGYNTPFKGYGCMRKNNNRYWPRCRWLSVCWPDLTGPGPFEEIF